MYASLPVGRYVQSKIKESGIKRVEIIRQCGCKNVTKGLRRLDALIQDSSPDTDLLKTLIDYAKKSGKAMFFGAIVGYLYQYTHNYGVEFSIDGRIIGEKKEFFDPPIHSLRIGNKIISGGMFSNL